MNTLHKSPESIDFLSEPEKLKYAKFRLPLIPCPTCGSAHKGSLLNLGFNRSCVSCSAPMILEEITSEGTKSLEYIKLDVQRLEDQEIVALFRDNVVWMCDHCGKGNANLKKGRNGKIARGVKASCEGCGSEYIKEDCLLPFVPLQGFGFDDGDDSDDSYELAMLFKTQGLWFQCIRKAFQEGMGTKGGKEGALKKLFSGLKKIKRKR